MSVAGRPRRAEGAEPAVPRKTTSRSTWSVQAVQGEGDFAVRGGAPSHGVAGRAGAVGGRAGVEDLEAVFVVLLVERDVGVAEDDRPRFREALAHADEAAGARARVVDDGDLRAVGVDLA